MEDDQVQQEAEATMVEVNFELNKDADPKVIATDEPTMVAFLMDANIENRQFIMMLEVEHA